MIIYVFVLCDDYFSMPLEFPLNHYCLLIIVIGFDEFDKPIVANGHNPIKNLTHAFKVHKLPTVFPSGENICLTILKSSWYANRQCWRAALAFTGGKEHH